MRMNLYLILISDINMYDLSIVILCFFSHQFILHVLCFVLYFVYFVYFTDILLFNL